MNTEMMLEKLGERINSPGLEGILEIVLIILFILFLGFFVFNHFKKRAK